MPAGFIVVWLSARTLSCETRPVGRSAEPERRCTSNRYLLPATRRRNWLVAYGMPPLGATSGELPAPLRPTLYVPAATLTVW